MELRHHGIRGQKWDVKNGPPYPIQRVFVSGSSKTQNEFSPYYRGKELSKPLKSKLDEHMSNGRTIVVGDAPGIDRQTQDYLKKKNYKRVEVYGPGKDKPRYVADEEWKQKTVDSGKHPRDSKEWLAEKDVEMTNISNMGLAVILDEGSRVTRDNVKRLIEQNKDVDIYMLSHEGEGVDSWVDKGKSVLFGPGGLLDMY